MVTKQFVLKESFSYQPRRMPAPEFLSRHAHAVRGGVNQVLWVSSSGIAIREN